MLNSRTVITEIINMFNVGLFSVVVGLVLRLGCLKYGTGLIGFRAN